MYAKGLYRWDKRTSDREGNLSREGCKNVFNKNLTKMPDERPGEKAHTTLLHCN